MHPIRLFVLDRGFVIVGRSPDPQDYALWLTLTDARVVRAWGTTRGLAELCQGPTEATRLDELCPSEAIPVRAILRVLEVDQDKWSDHLKGLAAGPSADSTRRTARSS